MGFWVFQSARKKVKACTIGLTAWRKNINTTAMQNGLSLLILKNGWIARAILMAILTNVLATYTRLIIAWDWRVARLA